MLDTSTCIDYLRGRSHSLRDRLLAMRPRDLCVSVVVVAELRYGADKSARPARNHGVVDDFLRDLAVIAWTEDAARAYGRIRSDLERSGQVIGPNDLLIAAHAVALERTLVTSDTVDFRRVSGLRVEDWRE